MTSLRRVLEPITSRERTVATALWLILVLGAGSSTVFGATRAAGAVEVAVVEVGDNSRPVVRVRVPDPQRSCVRPLPQPVRRARSVSARGLPAPRAPDLS